jgi:hypothetical protein
MRVSEGKEQRMWACVCANKNAINCHHGFSLQVTAEDPSASHIWKIIVAREPLRLCSHCHNLRNAIVSRFTDRGLIPDISRPFAFDCD